MRLTSADRELAIASIEERLRECLPALISDEAELTIHRVAELACSRIWWPQEMEETLSALKEIFEPLRRWSFAKIVIGSAIGKDVRTVQRLARRPKKGKSPGEELDLEANDQTPKQDLLANAESGVSTITDVCLQEAKKRAGRRWTSKVKVESDSAYTERIMREAKARFSSKGDPARRAGALYIRAQMTALGISLSDIEGINAIAQSEV